MHNNIEFSLQRVSKAITEKPFYRAVVQNNGIFGHTEIAERLAAHTRLDAVSLRYFLDVLTNEIEDNVAKSGMRFW